MNLSRIWTVENLHLLLWLFLHMQSVRISNWIRRRDKRIFAAAVERTKCFVFFRLLATQHTRQKSPGAIKTRRKENSRRSRHKTMKSHRLYLGSRFSARSIYTYGEMCINTVSSFSMCVRVVLRVAKSITMGFHFFSFHFSLFYGNFLLLCFFCSLAWRRCEYETPGRVGWGVTDGCEAKPRGVFYFQGDSSSFFLL